jgi:hypothetical protein
MATHARMNASAIERALHRKGITPRRVRPTPGGVSVERLEAMRQEKQKHLDDLQRSNLR